MTRARGSRVSDRDSRTIRSIADAYEAGIPLRQLEDATGVKWNTLAGRLKAAGVELRGRGGAGKQNLTTAETEAFNLGVVDGRELDGRDDDLSSGMTWPDPWLNELYDLGVNVGADLED